MSVKHLSENNTVRSEDVEYKKKLIKNQFVQITHTFAFWRHSLSTVRSLLGKYFV